LRNKETRKKSSTSSPKASSSFEKENLKTLERRFHGEGKLKACF
jgi:hypothetical protein